MLLAAAGLAILLGTLDALVDSYLLGMGHPGETFFHPGPYEIWTRSLVAVMTFVFVLLVGRAWRAERDLRIFSRAVWEAPDAVRITDRAGNILYSNKAVESLLGAPPEEWVGRSVVETTADPGKATEILGALAESGRWAGEVEVKHKDGRRIPVWLAASRVAGARGAPPVLIGILRDMTERRRAERALRASEERFRQVFEQSPIGMTITDPRGRLAQVNDACCRILGFDAKEVVGRTCEPGSGDEVPSCICVPPDGQVDERRRFVRKDGTEIWVHVRGSAMHDDEGRPLFGLAMITDVTDEVHVSQALLAAKDAAEAAERTKGELLDIASHELRSPLNVLGLAVQLAQNRLSHGQPVGQELLEKLERQTRRLAEMVSDLLDASRLDRGQLAMHPVPIDMRELVEATVEDFRSQAPDRHVSVELPADPVPIEADPGRIQQIVTNFLDNARKYTPPASPVEVRLSRENGSATLEVTDHGPGIGEADQERLFARFFRSASESTRLQPGLGLGLYICKVIAEAHHGTIGVRSVPGSGATFFVTLPEVTAPARPWEPGPGVARDERTSGHRT
ncbi:MAG: PAS domain S-box protein [Deltaproteobacteria bacterium]|nr:PAS domain S-box protein [Deltaproteobacteria bacterium]